MPVTNKDTSLNSNGFEYSGRAKLCIPAETVPNSGEITIRCGANVMQYEIYLAKNDNTTEQSYIIADPSKGTLTADAVIKWGGVQTETGDLQVTKIGGSGQPLSGAKFALFKEEPAAADYASESAAKASSKLYTNDVFDGIVESDANGRLKIEGLDADTYWLHEVSAPAGFIADNRTFKITIAATYTTIDGGVYENEDGITVKYDAYKVLEGYTVTVYDGTGTVTSTYNIENKGPEDHKVVDKATYQTITGEDFAGDSVTPIDNTQGTELPSTGGIGTTMFYIVGSVLVLCAVVLLISKRRMNAR